MKLQYSTFNDERQTISILNPIGWGQERKILYDQADAGYAVWGLYSHNNFDNKFHDADLQGYDERKTWTELFRDRVIGREKELGETSPGEDFFPVVYFASAGLPHEIRTNTWLPPAGFIVPVRNNVKGYTLFKPRTLAPEKTIPFDRRSEAERICIELGFPIEELSGFYRANGYRNQEYVVGRDFYPSWDDYGRFVVAADRLLSDSGHGGLASRPRYEGIEFLSEVSETSEIEVK